MSNQLPDCIVKLTGELNSTTDVTNETLTDVVERAGISEDALLHLGMFDHPAFESYGRRLLYENDKFSILLMTWNPGDFTAVHNHGVTEWGAVCFLGEAVHRLYEMKDGKVTLSRKDVFEKGKIIPMHGALTHMMGNGGKTGFLTLHIYGSGTNLNNTNIRETVFLPEHKLLTGTNGPAYLNMTESLEGGGEFFNGYAEETLLDYFNLIKPYYSRNKRDDMLEKISRFERNIDTYYR